MAARLTSIAITALVLYALVAGFMFAVQRKLQYFPSADGRTPLEAGVAGVNVVEIATPDGEKLRAWHIPAPAGSATVLYLHGNGGGISDRPLKIAHFAAQGFGVLALSYRGYEGSTGSPSERGLVTDAKAAYDWLHEAGRASGGIVLLGESLGTGVAVQLAAERPVRAVALEAPYANAVDIAAASYWFLPVRLLMKDQFRSLDYIARINAPLLVLHGRNDSLIPLAQGQKLFDAANQPKRMIIRDGSGHELIGDATLWQLESDFFREAINTSR